MTERRLFSRIGYRAPASIAHQQQLTTCQVIDMSLHGVCTSVPVGGSPLQPSEQALLRIDIPDSDVQLSMDVELVSFDASHLRFRIEQIDLDSISYLKRMVELNTGDEALLHRELAHLSHVHQED